MESVMTIEQPQHDKDGKHPPQEAARQMPFAGESRRRFTKTGLAASGVLLTLANRSALGAGITVSPSVYASGNTSGHGPAAPAVTLGLTPSYWSDPNKWPSNLNKNSRFQDIFSDCVNGKQFFNDKLKDLLGGTASDDPIGLGQYLVAAYLNNLAGRCSFLTLAQIKAMYTGVCVSGAQTYVPNQGAKPWTAYDVKNYLAGTCTG